MQRKYIFITGGVVSSLGKGLTSASIAMLLEEKGYQVAMLKLDPYLNVDPGTMNPFQHGEVYVTDDGAETDLDLGHYHRYTNSPLSKESNVTSGQIYHSVITQERRGDYLGNTVQVIPHITNEIKKRILQCASARKETQITLVEIGGTVGDIESLPFMEAIRQFRNEQEGNCINIHLTYVPHLKAAGEVKTKPTQHSVQMLRQIGLFPDIILCRCENPLDDEVKNKISLFCNVNRSAVFDEEDVAETIYEVPLRLHEQKLGAKVSELLGIEDVPIELKKWKELVHTILNPEGEISIAVVGKYIQHQDAYKSVFEALDHGAMAAKHKLKIVRIDSDKLEGLEDLKEKMAGCHAILVPGGFGSRGWKGKLLAAQLCREENIPYFGICLGMHIMAVEFARNVCGIKEAHSTEVDATCSEPIISLLTEQHDVKDLGGTMRLGAYPCQLKPGSLTFKAYNAELIHERHRHRYEFNNKYLEPLKEAGLEFTGMLEERNLYEVIEVKNHPWMIGVQYHPEFLSKPTDSHPLFRDFIKAAIARKATQ